MKSVFFILTLLGISTTGFADPSTKLALGKKIGTGTCVACHGPAGVSNNDLWPNLAGQKRGYLVKALQDYKAGRRNDPLMSPQAMLLSDEDIENVAIYFSGLKND